MRLAFAAVIFLHASLSFADVITQQAAPGLSIPSSTSMPVNFAGCTIVSVGARSAGGAIPDYYNYGSFKSVGFSYDARACPVNTAAVGIAGWEPYPNFFSAGIGFHNGIGAANFKLMCCPI